MLGLLAGGGLLADHPGAAEVGVEAPIHDADVDPQHVAGGQVRSVLISGQARSPCTVQGSSAWCSGITCQIGSSMLASAPSSKIRCRKVAVRSIWRAPGTNPACTSTMACSVIHSPWRSRASSSGVLTQPGRAEDLAGRPGWPLGEQAVVVAVHGPGQLVDRHHRAGGDQVGQRRGEGLDPLVEVEVGGAVAVVVVEAESGAGVGRIGREEVRLVVVDQHDRHRSLDVGPAGVAHAASWRRWRRRRWRWPAAPGRRCPSRPSGRAGGRRAGPRMRTRSGWAGRSSPAMAGVVIAGASTSVVIGRGRGRSGRWC